MLARFARSQPTVMQSSAVVALALLESVQAFQAPVMRSAPVQMFSEGDIGVLPPLGVYDPLGLIETRDMARYEIMEIKHGRAAMLGFLHVIAVEAGAKIPTEECLAAPTGLIASLESMPTFGWLQIMLFCCMQETGAGNESSFFSLAKPQTVDAEAGKHAYLMGLQHRRQIAEYWVPEKASRIYVLQNDAGARTWPATRCCGLWHGCS